MRVVFDPSDTSPGNPWSPHRHPYDGGKCVGCRELARKGEMVQMYPRGPGSLFYHAACVPSSCSLCAEPHPDGQCLI